MSDNNFRLGLEVLNKLPVKKPRKKNPTAHIYRQKDGSMVFNAIIHEDPYNMKTLRVSRKSKITIVPEDITPKHNNSLRYLFWCVQILTGVLFLTMSTFIEDARYASAFMVIYIVLFISSFLLYGALMPYNPTNSNDSCTF